MLKQSLKETIMALHFNTRNPSGLLNEFNSKIDQLTVKGKITTWERSSDGEYYTHKALEWAKKAWFKPEIKADKLVFNIIKPKNASVSVQTYGYYHGHLSETFLNHFDSKFEAAVSTALPSSGDILS